MREIITLECYNRDLNYGNGRLYKGAGPYEWVYLLQHASYVCMDSFHATVFSILFGKPFVVIGNKERGLSRIYSLLEMFGLEKHIINSIEDLNLKQGYGYDVQQVNERLRSVRQQSLLFLQQSLS